MAFYLRHSVLPVEEDMTHEFKAHRQLSKSDLSSLKYTHGHNGTYTTKVRPARASLSKSICGMLNTGLGGTIYLGVTDAGRVAGLMCSLFQKDHFRLALSDLLERYRPKVDPEMVKVNFVPVLDCDCGDELNKADPIDLDMPRWLPHELRESRYCWCDRYL